MGRRTVLIVVAIVVAALGATLVLLYVQGIDHRAVADQQPVQVLKATALINAGETAEQAQSEGKLALGTVPSVDVLSGALTSTDSIKKKAALVPIYPGEQIIAAKFGGGAATVSTGLDIPKGKLAISVQLTDTNRVAGFVKPGSHVAIFLSAWAQGMPSKPDDYTRLLLPDVEVIAVGATTTLQSTTQSPDGTATTEQVPTTIMTLALNQDQAQKVLFAAKYGELAFALRTTTSKVSPDSGAQFKNLFQ